MLSCWRLTPTLCLSTRHRSGFYCRTASVQSPVNGDQNKNGEEKKKKKIVIVGSGWAGLGAAHHLCNQVLSPPSLSLEKKKKKHQSCDSCEMGIFCFRDLMSKLLMMEMVLVVLMMSASKINFVVICFWYPYRNIFSLVDELGIEPFTNWMKSVLYSEGGLEVEFPIFQDLPQLPTPLGTLFYTQFNRVPLVDRLTSLALMAAGIYIYIEYSLSFTARELFKQFGCSERLYRDVIGPLLQVGLFAPAEQCSAAATLGILYYFILAHQKNFDLVWCQGTLKEKIFDPWMDSMRTRDCEFLDGRKVTDFVLNEETGCISEVVCGKEKYNADAVILAVAISTLQELVKNSYPVFDKAVVLCSAALCTREEEFLKVSNLSCIDVISVKVRLDKKVNIPNASNACSGFGDSFSWTFFDLTQIYDEHKDDPVTVLQADFYHANVLLPLKDEQVLAKVMSCLSKCIEEFSTATITDKQIRRFPKSLTHYFPGSYKYMMRGSTSFPNLFMAGDWITTRHGSWSQEKSYVTGLEAANRVVDYLEDGSFAKIIPVEEDEAHIETLRNLNRRFNEIREQVPLSNYFLQ
ncbi:hypothetical protein EZV62_011872 [Acer yangbiense]|uniref:Amine oxidase domain-containing protein n=1 Tax=Acer yangbiense TaxID=1000413 RepID=A0A5C7I756_9ROSI|nr:hypothetical protein EZV62_011872 [Acer yangbiense]